jgi:hypothetical protein
LEPTAAPFLLSSFVWEPQVGRFALTAVAVAMARLSHGREAVWTDPTGIEPLYDEAQALIARSNLVAPYKPRVDVVVVGHAYAPPGADVDWLLARVRLGDFSKAISVTGDRLWVRDGARWGSSAPRPFSRMLLVPERALRSAENPVGLDPAAIPVEGRLALPNLEPAAGSYSAVLGPIPAPAPSRRNMLSPASAQWLNALELGQRPGPVPEGFNFAFFNVAPLDQQLGDIPPGSAIVLENLHPREPIFTSRLPPLGPALIAVDGASGRRLDMRSRCDTVWIDGDREIVMMVYRATCELERPDLRIHLRADVEAPAPLRPMAHAAPPNMLVTQQGSLNAPPSALPFAGRSGHPLSPQGAAPWPRGDHAPDSRRHGVHLGQAYADPHGAPAPSLRDETTNPLPERESYPPPPPAPPKRSITSEIVLTPEQALPFQQSGSADGWDTHTHDLGPGALPRQDTPALGHETLPPPPAAGSELPFPGPRGAPPAGEGQVAETNGTTPRDGSSGPSALAKKRLLPIGPVGPVPDVGPTPPPALPAKPQRTQVEPQITTAPLAIAIPALGGRPREPAPSVAVQPSAAESGGVEPGADIDETMHEGSFPEPLPEPEPTPPPRESITLEECAAIRAELSKKSADRAEVLARHHIEDATWHRLEREHLRAIDEASQGGDQALLERYDDAYVAACDELRTAIDELAYARLQLAKENGRLANLLEELAISRAELLRLDRVWRRRLQTDRSLAERLEDEIERLRQEG